eukprot:TRINITY_DN20193_c0_g1_i1.p1 TRINITY_DN20193_c0_g1~~TRINITY_DN20193_c0_g1_i1.p1  ORF type:complete len:188 (+),score=18.55 TRINITY_DN20193_c0_g1_i1:58-621(+)
MSRISPMGACRSRQPKREEKEVPISRYVFISASFLAPSYESIPRDALQHALLFFGSKRSWVFPSTDQERRESLRQPTKYLEFSDAFREFILQKEAENHVFWLKNYPENERYTRASEWFTSLSDPESGTSYLPLKLKAADWQGHRQQRLITQNIAEGGHDYNSVTHLVNVSNPNLRAVLTWSDRHSVL